MRKLLPLLPCIFAITLFTCTSEESFNGVLAGSVQTYGPCDFTIVDKAGVNVYLTDSTTKKFIKSTTTDVEGYYYFDNIPNGIYNIRFDRSDLAPTTIFGHHFKNSANDIVDTQLVQKRTNLAYSIGNFSILEVDDSNYKITGYYVKKKECLFVGDIFFLAKNELVSYVNYMVSAATPGTSSGTSANISADFTRAYLLSNGFKPGDKVYVTGYLNQRHGLPYYDPVYKVVLYPNIDPTSKFFTHSFLIK